MLPSKQGSLFKKQEFVSSRLTKYSLNSIKQKTQEFENMIFEKFKDNSLKNMYEQIHY